MNNERKEDTYLIPFHQEIFFEFQRRLEQFLLNHYIGNFSIKNHIINFKKKFVLLLKSMSYFIPNLKCHIIWHSSKIKEGEFNFISYRNKEIDRLLLEGRGTFDIEKRKEIYHRVHEILVEDQPYTFLYVPDALPVLHKRFKGVEKHRSVNGMTSSTGMYQKIKQSGIK